MKKPKVYPLAIIDENEMIAWIDIRGNYHYKKGKKKRVVQILISGHTNEEVEQINKKGRQRIK